MHRKCWHHLTCELFTSGLTHLHQFQVRRDECKSGILNESNQAGLGFSSSGLLGIWSHDSDVKVKYWICLLVGNATCGLFHERT